MLIVIPYPNGEKFISVIPASDNKEIIAGYRKDILEYVNMVCTGPWQSDDLDVLHNGVRVRLGRQKDYFMLQLKYGTAKEY